MMKKLMLAVCARRELYDTKAVTHWERAGKENAWNKICKICNAWAFHSKPLC